MMSWFRPRSGRQEAERVYEALVAQARRPEFYAALGVPDTVDGRFEMLALHVFLLLRRIKADPAAADLGQALVDLFVEDMDASLREMGAGDLGVGRRVRSMAQGLYGRIGAYDAALGAGEGAFEEALMRNVFATRPAGGSPQAAAELAAYAGRELAALALIPAAQIAEGRFAFGPPPGGGPVATMR
jgi:cytochrome b pre-mRNA-processing protein 3